jgi:phosphoribosylaminoimidazole-succinocarboxamide synthase
MVEVECVARGYLTGSGLKEYAETQSVCGVPLPAGLVDGSRLPEPIFTPTTKAPVGEHDLPMTFAEVVDTVGHELATQLRDTTIAVYARGVDLAGEAGIILADTKVELGHDSAGVLTLADEVLTPDSSRFWPAESYEAGRAQPSFDKQYVRDWLSASGWDKRPPAPELPADVVLQTRAKYVEAYERLTGRSFDDYLKES